MKSDEYTYIPSMLYVVLSKYITMETQKKASLLSVLTSRVVSPKKVTFVSKKVCEVSGVSCHQFKAHHTSQVSLRSHSALKFLV